MADLLDLVEDVGLDLPVLGRAVRSVRAAVDQRRATVRDLFDGGLDAVVGGVQVKQDPPRTLEEKLADVEADLAEAEAELRRAQNLDEPLETIDELQAKEEILRTKKATIEQRIKERDRLPDGGFRHIE